jgi:hypothetical protein
MILQDTPVSELIYKLRRQYFTGVTTCCQCECGKPVRGSGWCADCLSYELRRRGASAECVDALKAARQSAVAIGVAEENLVEAIMRECKQ